MAASPIPPKRPARAAYYTVREVAEIFNLSISKVYERCDSGEWVCERFGRNGKGIRIPVAFVGALLEQSDEKVKKHFSVPQN